jgi:hypothetical protein
MPGSRSVVAVRRAEDVDIGQSVTIDLEIVAATH